ncbi:hypothetical protein STW0522PSE72_36500 [Pseudomonas monteilii]|nr:hypothetical protein STW0522PSE72_36500 [Pseudomonas monteilii]
MLFSHSPCNRLRCVLRSRTGKQYPRAIVAYCQVKNPTRSLDDSVKKLQGPCMRRCRSICRAVQYQLYRAPRQLS